MDMYGVATAIIKSSQLTAHGRRHKILSAIAAVLADDEYDDLPLDDLLQACTDHNIALDYGIELSFPSSACTVCLAETPWRVSLCARCKAAGKVSALDDSALRPPAQPVTAFACPDCGTLMVHTCSNCGLGYSDIIAAAEYFDGLTAAAIAS